MTLFFKFHVICLFVCSITNNVMFFSIVWTTSLSVLFSIIFIPRRTEAKTSKQQLELKCYNAADNERSAYCLCWCVSKAIRCVFIVLNDNCNVISFVIRSSVNLLVNGLSLRPPLISTTSTITFRVYRLRLFVAVSLISWWDTSGDLWLKWFDAMDNFHSTNTQIAYRIHQTTN